GGFEVYEEVGSFDIVDNAMENSAVAFKVPRAHQAHVVQVLGKYISIFIDGTVLNHIDAAFLQINNMLETAVQRSEEHTSELQSRENLVCRLLLEKKKYY